jgi:hypothetical protein
MEALLHIITTSESKLGPTALSIFLLKKFLISDGHCTRSSWVNNDAERIRRAQTEGSCAGPGTPRADILAEPGIFDHRPSCPLYSVIAFPRAASLEHRLHHRCVLLRHVDVAAHASSLGASGPVCKVLVSLDSLSNDRVLSLRRSGDPGVASLSERRVSGYTSLPRRPKVATLHLWWEAHVPTTVSERLKTVLYSVDT